MASREAAREAAREVAREETREADRVAAMLRLNNWQKQEDEKVQKALLMRLKEVKAMHGLC